MNERAKAHQLCPGQKIVTARHASTCGDAKAQQLTPKNAGSEIRPYRAWYVGLFPRIPKEVFPAGLFYPVAEIAIAATAKRHRGAPWRGEHVRVLDRKAKLQVLALRICRRHPRRIGVLLGVANEAFLRFVIGQH